MKILSIVAARPNFMKIAPFTRAIKQYNQEHNSSIEHVLVHTGQHYDIRMSEAFFEELNIPEPDINLEIGSGSHGEQLGYTMIAFEKALIDQKPDCVVVVGDVNATLSCSVIAKRLNIKVCHIEAGLRSGDMTMPEEVNRLVTDRISDLLLTPDRMSSKNLFDEGTPASKVKFVGNIMIDTLEENKDIASKLDIKEILVANSLKEHPFQGEAPAENSFAIVTLHRPSNVDDEAVIVPLVNFLTSEVTNDLKVIWPIHPRTEKQLKRFGIWEKIINNKSVILLQPLAYREMLRLNIGARIVLTDSGGLQEECCVLGTPCLTLRWNTERPVTLRENGGASVLVGNNIERIRDEYNKTIRLNRTPARPELWDGKTAQRCLTEIVKLIEEKE